MPFLAYPQLIAKRNVIKNGYNFWLYLPKDYVVQKEKMPVIIFLHGSSLCGNDLNRVRRYGPLHAVALGRQIDAMIIAPQNPGGSWNPQKVLNVLQWTEQHYALDSQRVYVIGMSLGGYGVLDFVGTYPDKVAAAMALCGGSTLKDYCGMGTIPLWIMHGTADRAVSLNESQKVVNGIKACGNADLLRFDTFPGVSHGGLAKVLYLEETYAWLLSHTKDNPEYVNREISITKDDFQYAYTNVDKKATQFEVIDSNALAPAVADNSTKSKTNCDSKNAHNNDYMGRTDEGDEKAVAEYKPRRADTLANSSKPEQGGATISNTSASMVKKSNTAVTAPKTTVTASNKAKITSNTPVKGKLYHTIKQGDTLYSIAKKNNTTVDQLCKLNRIKETDILPLGKKLWVK